MSWLINPEWAPLLAGNPGVDEIIVFPRQQFRGLGGWVNLARWGREQRARQAPDLALDFQGLLRTALLGRASKAGVLYGMSDAREGARWFYDQVAPMPAGVVHSVERYLALVDHVLGPSVAAPPDLCFPLPAGDPIEEANVGLGSDFILLHPFARGAGKSLTSGQIERLCAHWAPRQVVVAGRGGAPPIPLPGAAVDLLDRTSLPQLIWLLRRAAVVVSVDSGPSHLTAALGRPLVVIHTWSDPRRVGPYRDEAWVWKSGRLLPMKDLRKQENSFFQQVPKTLSTADLDSIGDRAISLAGSCA